MRAKRAAEKDLTLHPVADPKRRAACAADPYEFLRVYFPQFDRPFTAQQKEIIESIIQTAKYGGSLAIAASRGEGKTSIAQYLVGVYCVITGLLRFPLICAATGPHAARILGNMKRQYTRNQLLWEDYPEVCVPLWDVRLAPQRGPSQTVNGEPTFCQWAGDQVVMPTVAGSKASGAILATTGLDAAVRGLMVDGQRPDFVLIDDPETRESSASEEQCAKRELLIEEDLAGLGGQKSPLSMVMLTTCMRRVCLSAKYTDPAQKPAWRGRRFRLVEDWPSRMDLWDEYCVMRAANKQTGDDNAREAHEFYLKNRELMDLGAKVANPYRFKGMTLPDGTALEVSALQSCFNIIADTSREHFDTEYQNDPREESGPIESGITAHRIQKQVSGLPRRLVPMGAVKLTQGIDCRKVALHWVVRAWMPDGTGHTIDYGVTEVRGTTVGTDEGLDEALKRALSERKAQIEETPYANQDGTAVKLDMTVIDSGWRSEAIYEWTLQAGLSWKPSMGFGKSSGCASPQFFPPVRGTQDKKCGDQWFLSRRPKGVWLVCMNADDWKAWEHDRWMSDPLQAGALLLFGDKPAAAVLQKNPHAMSQDQKWHMSYAKHLTAEVEVEEPNKDGVLVRKWKARSDNNHYLDASYRASVAASIVGVKLLGRRLLMTPPQTPGSGGWFDQQQRRA